MCFFSWSFYYSFNIWEDNSKDSLNDSALDNILDNILKDSLNDSVLDNASGGNPKGGVVYNFETGNFYDVDSFFSQKLEFDYFGFNFIKDNFPVVSYKLKAEFVFARSANDLLPMVDEIKAGLASPSCYIDIEKTRWKIDRFANLINADIEYRLYLHDFFNIFVKNAIKATFTEKFIEGSMEDFLTIINWTNLSNQYDMVNSSYNNFHELLAAHNVYKIFEISHNKSYMLSFSEFLENENVFSKFKKFLTADQLELYEYYRNESSKCDKKELLEAMFPFFCHDLLVKKHYILDIKDVAIFFYCSWISWKPGLFG